VCQAVGARSVGYGRAYFVADAKWQALIRCERYSGICIISYRAFRRPDYWLKPRRKSLRTPRTTREARHEGIHKSGKVRIAISAPARRCVATGRDLSQRRQPQNGRRDRFTNAGACRRFGARRLTENKESPRAQGRGFRLPVRNVRSAPIVSQSVSRPNHPKA